MMNFPPEDPRVSGHLVLGFDRVAEDLERLGYRVAAGVFTASEVGASHQRERLFILAHREDERRRAWGPKPAGARRPNTAIRECSMADPSRICEHGRERSRSGSGGRIREASEGMGNPCECGQCGQSWRGTGP